MVVLLEKENDIEISFGFNFFSELNFKGKKSLVNIYKQCYQQPGTHAKSRLSLESKKRDDGPIFSGSNFCFSMAIIFREIFSHIAIIKLSNYTKGLFVSAIWMAYHHPDGSISICFNQTKQFSDASMAVFPSIKFDRHVCFSTKWMGNFLDDCGWR